jgi:hypothetical protein|tara:strand:+ start:567 stop:686 length:120 start_codon:yes stop_codon:yes gene_type:complete
MEEELTTISMKPSTKDMLDKLKIHPNQSYEEVIIKLLDK